MTNPFLKYKEQVARTMCSHFHKDDENWLNARENVRDLWRDEATAALDALWNAMQAEGSVMSETFDFDGHGCFDTPVLIIRTEPTDA